MVHGGKAYLDGIELYHMGQLSQMGRYPIHWHLKGDAQGEYLLNSSIHRSFQRCVTVHGTNRLRVQNNVCYDHYGHGYFIEDGNETGNRFIHNLGLYSKRPPPGRQLLFSDNQTTRPLAFDPPATFWIANPANEFVDNAAAGSMGAGYWFSLKSVVVGASPLPPNQTDLLRFERNVAHSSLTGVTIDGGPLPGVLTPPNPNNGDDLNIGASHYAPASGTMPVFRGLTIFKTAGTGFWARGDKMEIVDSVFGDNLRAITFSFQQKLKDSLVVAKSANFDALEVAPSSLVPSLPDNSFPRGTLEYVGSQITGWACDPDDFSQPLEIEFRASTGYALPQGVIGTAVANLPRGAEVASACGGSANHGFAFSAAPIKVLPKSIYAYAQNINPPNVGTGGNPLLTASPSTMWTQTPSGAPLVRSPLSAGLAAPLQPVFTTPGLNYNITRRIWGVGLYDGPWALENVHFANFDGQPWTLPDGSEIVVSPFPLFGGTGQATSNMASDITFDPPFPYRKAFLMTNHPIEQNADGGEWAAAILDVDGSLTGSAGHSIVPNHPINFIPGCVDKPDWKAYVCPARYANIRMIRSDDPSGAATLTYSLRRGNGTIYDFTQHRQNKFGFVMNQGQGYSAANVYELFPAFTLNSWTDLEFQYVMPNESTPIIKIADPGNLTILTTPTAAEVFSLEALWAATQTAYYRGAAGYLHFKMVANLTNTYWAPYNGRGTARLCRTGMCN